MRENEGKIWEMVGSYRTVKEIMALPSLNLGAGSMILMCVLRKNLVIVVPVRGQSLTLVFQCCGELNWWCFCVMAPKRCKNMNLGIGRPQLLSRRKEKG